MKKSRYNQEIEDYIKNFSTIYSQLESKVNVSENDKNKAGIYVLYINKYKCDIEKENKIIPVYIGETTDLLRRKKQHYLELNKKMNLSKKEANNILKQHSEQTYLYFKIRKCLIESDLSIDDICMKVIEYTETDKNILKEKEKYYIEQFGGLRYGFNQFETNALINQFSATDDYFKRFLSSAKKEMQECIDRKYFFGFRSFNIKSLCNNIQNNMFRMSKCKTESKEIIELNSEVVNLIHKMWNEYYDYNTYMDLDFIEYELKVD